MLQNYTMHARHQRHPESTNAYLVGGGIASLAAAVHLIHDAHVPPSRIYILESGPVLGRSMNSRGTPEAGYILQDGLVLDSSYVCLYDLLSTIPSLANPAKTVKQEINEFNVMLGNRTHATARLVASATNGPQIVDGQNLGLSEGDRNNLLRVLIESEDKLGDLRITDCFEKAFFGTNFWFLWATT
jgi:oleate hydratase